MEKVKPITRRELYPYLSEDEIAQLTKEDLQDIAELEQKLIAEDEKNGWWDMLHVAAQAVLEKRQKKGGGEHG